MPKQLTEARRRARKYGLPAKLTNDQWRAIVEHYQDRCAYCGGPNESIDHFIPLHARQQGTTKRNCVPCCFQCNAAKGGKMPEEVASLVPNMKQVRKFLLHRQ